MIRGGGYFQREGKASPDSQFVAMASSIRRKEIDGKESAGR